MVVPLPSSPTGLLPQAQTVPSDFNAMASLAPPQTQVTLAADTGAGLGAGDAAYRGEISPHHNKATPILFMACGSKESLPIGQGLEFGKSHGGSSLDFARVTAINAAFGHFMLGFSHAASSCAAGAWLKYRLASRRVRRSKSRNEGRCGTVLRHFGSGPKASVRRSAKVQIELSSSAA